MACDFSWEGAARKYVQLYREVNASRRIGPGSGAGSRRCAGGNRSRILLRGPGVGAPLGRLTLPEVGV